MDLDRGIGRDNDLMWNLPADMKFFKESTLDQVVIMGRKNYDSIPERFRPLPKRQNVVLTRNKSFEAEGCLVFHDLESSLEHFQNDDRDVYIIGGGQIYKEALEQNVVQEMYITHVNKRYGADTFFPEFDLKSWVAETIDEHPIDERHEASFSILKYTKRS